MKNEQYKEAVNSLVRHIQDADAIVVGALPGCLQRRDFVIIMSMIRIL